MNDQPLIPDTDDDTALLARIYELERQTVLLAEGLTLALSQLRRLQGKVPPDE